ncbi:2OG-Fe(II) oxygenase [Alphaproteobacteria bacterium]|nr:2OG-Fe(II) oxygenase [Alphaproteobacteria bacterium]
MFLTDDEISLSKNFVKNGYIVFDCPEINILQNITDFFIKEISKYSPDIKNNKNHQAFLNDIHKYISVKNLNKFRLDIINKMTQDKNLRKNYYLISKKILDIIVGNELAMQNRVNLSIQFPKDDSSLLPVHADTWSGDSPFEVVVWIPLVDCFHTKSMYILPPKKFKKIEKKIKSVKDSNGLFKLIRNDLDWINIKYGQILIFNQSLPHGNVVNKTKETRWSMNCRFKSLFSPYGDKGIGEFFEPITLRAATKLGLEYKFPF